VNYRTMLHVADKFMGDCAPNVMYGCMFGKCVQKVQIFERIS